MNPSSCGWSPEERLLKQSQGPARDPWPWPYNTHLRIWPLVSFASWLQHHLPNLSDQMLLLPLEPCLNQGS